MEMVEVGRGGNGVLRKPEPYFSLSFLEKDVNL